MFVQYFKINGRYTEVQIARWDQKSGRNTETSAQGPIREPENPESVRNGTVQRGQGSAKQGDTQKKKKGEIVKGRKSRGPTRAGGEKRK